MRVVKVYRNNTGIAILAKKKLSLCRVGRLFNRGSSRKEVQAKRRQQRRESVAAVAAAVAAHHTAVNASDVHGDDDRLSSANFSVRGCVSPGHQFNSIKKGLKMATKGPQKNFLKGHKLQLLKTLKYL